MNREEKLDVLMETIYPSFRDRWCEASVCGCMGCVNDQLLGEGFTKEDHVQWKLRQTRKESK